jgi:hypothetical protein
MMEWAEERRELRVRIEVSLLSHCNTTVTPLKYYCNTTVTPP